MVARELDEYTLLSLQYYLSLRRTDITLNIYTDD